MNHALAQAIPGRELIELPGHGVMVRGTLHWSRPATDGRIGIAFLNSLSLPRTATGDSAVYWAESFAASGYPSFRIDLPGLGDTNGDIPSEVLNFINAGGYAEITAAKVKELVETFGLSGVILIGHCAGTISAINAATACKEVCEGLILLDPYFHITQAIRPMVRRGLSNWALHSRIGRTLSNFYDRTRNIRLRFRGNALPRNANFPLLSRWKEVASSGVPILMIKAPSRKSSGTGPRQGEFDYLKYVLQLAGRKGHVVVELIEGTDHSFANRLGRIAVQQRIESWLGNYFPLRTNSRVEALLDEADGSRDYNQYHLDCLQP